MVYSILNDYSYTDKSFGMKALDLLSLPARTLLGGRRINLVALIEETPSTTQKVAKIALLIIPPLSLISFAALLVKKIVSESQRQIVVEKMDKARKAIESFPTTLKSAFEEVTKNPGILKNPTVEKSFRNLIENYIADVPLLKEGHIDVLKDCIQPFKGQKLFEVLFSVLKKWIEKEFAGGIPTSKPSYFRFLIVHFYQGFNNTERNLLYKKLCEEVLQIRNEDSLHKITLKFYLLSDFLQEFVEHLNQANYCGPVHDKVHYVSNLMPGLFGVYQDPAKKDRLLKAIDKLYQINASEAFIELSRFEKLPWEVLQAKWYTIRYYLLNSLDPVTENDKIEALKAKIDTVNEALKSKDPLEKSLTELQTFAKKTIFNCPVDLNERSKAVFAYILNARCNVLDLFIHNFWAKRQSLC